MPLEQLQQLVGQRADEVLALVDHQAQAIDEPMAAMAPMASPDIGGVTPELVQSATAVLVEAGLLQQVATNITPEVLAVLEQVVDATSPGLFDLNNPLDVEELLNGIRNGLIPIGSADPGSPPGGLPPDPGLPPGGPGGLPGGAPGGLPPGIPGGGLPPGF